jgi:hypothetical protein
MLMDDDDDQGKRDASNSDIPKLVNDCVSSVNEMQKWKKIKDATKDQIFEYLMASGQPSYTDSSASRTFEIYDKKKSVPLKTVVAKTLEQHYGFTNAQIEVFDKQMKQVKNSMIETEPSLRIKKPKKNSKSRSSSVPRSEQKLTSTKSDSDSKTPFYLYERPMMD